MFFVGDKLGWQSLLNGNSSGHVNKEKLQGYRQSNFVKDQIGSAKYVQIYMLPRIGLVLYFYEKRIIFAQTAIQNEKSTCYFFFLFYIPFMFRGR